MTSATIRHVAHVRLSTILYAVAVIQAVVAGACSTCDLSTSVDVFERSKLCTQLKFCTRALTTIALSLSGRVRARFSGKTCALCCVGGLVLVLGVAFLSSQVFAVD